jgi:hypothetical protein
LGHHVAHGVCPFTTEDENDESNKEISIGVSRVNPQRNIFVHKLSHHGKFNSQQDVKDELSIELGSLVEDVGYNAITSDHDAYEKHCSKRCEIRLWCLSAAPENSTLENESRRKRSHENVEALPTAKRISSLRNVEEIVDRLSEKHGANFPAMKFNAWVHLINNMWKHSSYNEPPNLPYYGKRR